MPARHDAAWDQCVPRQGHGARDAPGALHNHNLAPRDLQPHWPHRGDTGSIQGGCTWLGLPGTGVPWLR